LHAQGIPTLVLDDLSSGYREQVQSSPLLVANLMEVDLRGIIEERGVDAVFHLATSAYVPPSFADPIDDLRRNTTSTLRVLEAARAVRRPRLVAYASSPADEGQGRHMPMNADHA